jgi:hypothetical protein
MEYFWSLFAVLATTMPALACAPLAGADQLWSKPALHYVIVGEMHGTTETPVIFADLVCAAQASERPVVVGLERNPNEQPAIDAFLRAENHAAAVSDLLALPGWHNSDGRASRAMLALLESLRAMKANVVAFNRGADKPDSEREQAMASALLAAAQDRKDALVIALTGNLHSARKPMAGYPPMAMLLPQAETISLLVIDRGGEIWGIMDGVPGRHKLNSSGGGERSVDLSPNRAPIVGHDGVLSTGLPATASPPARAR